MLKLEQTKETERSYTISTVDGKGEPSSLEARFKLVDKCWVYEPCTSGTTIHYVEFQELLKISKELNKVK